MYLVHLPIVVWLQVAVAEVRAPWWLKLAGISLATVAIALITYDLFVRSTCLGALLNGRRRERVFFRLYKEANPTAEIETAESR
jgi:peptidoglycan/LPS O-acetylase OafA/YrhL